MAFQSVPNTAEIVLTFGGSGATWVNVLHAFKTSGYDETSLQALADVVDQWVVDEILPLMSSSHTYGSTVVRGLENLNDLEVIATAGAGVGLISSPPVPINAAAVVTLQTAFTGRSARGRVYFGGLSENQSNTSTSWAAGTVEAFRDAIAALIALLQAIDWVLSVVSRYSQGVKRTEGVNFAVTAAVARNNFVDSQRGRLTKGH